MDKKTRLGAVGVLFLVVGLGLWWSERDAGSSTVVETYTRSTVKQSTDPAETTEEVQMSGAASPGVPGSSNKRSTSGAILSQTITRPSAKTVTTSTKPPRSDALVLGLIGLGSAFLLSAAFYGRIAGFKILGTEVTLVSGTKDLEEAVGELRASQEVLKRAVRSLTSKVKDRRS